MTHSTTGLTASTSPQAWVSDTQLARHFAVSRTTIWRWAKDGRLPKPKKIAPGTTRWWMPDIKAMEG